MTEPPRDQLSAGRPGPPEPPGRGVHPYGLAAMARLDLLPLLRLHTMAGGQSSYERDTRGPGRGNDDWNNFLDVRGGEKVMLDQRGPGTVYRIWVTGFDPATDWLRVRFDDEPAPRIDIALRDLFSGTHAPFLSPLVADAATSSGGFTCHLPLPYRRSIRITTNMSGYYNIGYHTFGPGTPVTTWTGDEDSTRVRHMWSDAGADPKAPDGDPHEVTVTAGVVHLPSGAARTIFEADGPRSISSIRIAMPGVTAAGTVTDRGRAHRGHSRFRIAVSPANSGVVLSRRTDHGVADQRARVLVDGVAVGEWSDPGRDRAHRWRDSSFDVPSWITAGRSALTVRLECVPTAAGWTEFTYRVYSTVGDTAVLTDTVDVGDPESEARHGYAIGGQTRCGSLVAGYDTADLLNTTRIRMFWDGEATPSVDAPLGAFFGMGRFGAYPARGLVVGLDPADRLYVHLPMPFRRHARIDLVNTRAAPTCGVGFEVRHRPGTGGVADPGYLRTRLTATTPTVIGQDVPILDTAGSGTFIGVTASYSGAANRWYLEGDERIYVDDSGSPAFHGTGTEDFFNGGWYFDRGPYTQPLSGNTAHLVRGPTSCVAAYRFLLQDAVPFRRRIRVSIEHGGHNDTTTDAWMLAYYYQQPRSRMVLTDTLDVGNAADEAAHAYRISAQRWTGSRTYQYEGTADTVDVTDTGRAHRGASEFVLAIDPTGDGVVLRRRFDQSITNQHAEVHVDGRLVGAWYVAGGNRFRRWRDADFLIPPSATAGKESVRVVIRFVASELDWNEFTYWAYTLLP
ncbi:DUF2961 domain-containing protein [Pseudonocardia bannensis]|uniref:DUF2961 domain-containing protein n=1 Tax=Pseudonocardia bannensis TaxID=630973 RepID=A0A848DI18_9PSEU|nr:DUF2961 domain-containing protein [Pseudonocardia bannensis]NMH92206.1 DUF2961 domain-containing protein [Pseudonocardia bannensis]